MWRGVFPVEKLNTLRKAGSFLQGHPEIHTPGIDMTSGCLGQGLSVGAGMAVAAKIDRKSLVYQITLVTQELINHYCSVQN